MTYGPDKLPSRSKFWRSAMKSMLKLLLVTLGVLVLVVVAISAGTVILEALDGYEDHRSAISGGES